MRNGRKARKRHSGEVVEPAVLVELGGTGVELEKVVRVFDVNFVRGDANNWS